MKQTSRYIYQWSVDMDIGVMYLKFHASVTSSKILFYCGPQLYSTVFILNCFVISRMLPILNFSLAKPTRTQYNTV